MSFEPPPIICWWEISSLFGWKRLPWGYPKGWRDWWSLWRWWLFSVATSGYRLFLLPVSVSTWQNDCTE